MIREFSFWTKASISPTSFGAGIHKRCGSGTRSDVLRPCRNPGIWSFLILPYASSDLMVHPEAKSLYAAMSPIRSGLWTDRELRSEPKKGSQFSFVPQDPTHPLIPPPAHAAFPRSTRSTTLLLLASLAVPAVSRLGTRIHLDQEATGAFENLAIITGELAGNL